MVDVYNKILLHSIVIMCCIQTSHRDKSGVQYYALHDVDLIDADREGRGTSPEPVRHMTACIKIHL